MEEEIKSPALIDIEKVIASKSPTLAKRLPRFVLRFFKRILHEDEINEFLKSYGNSRGIDFINNIFYHFNYSYTTQGLDNLDTAKRYIIASNHPIGGLDGISLIHATNSKFGDVKFLVNDILMNLKNIEEFFIPINKHGSLSRDVAKVMDEEFRSDKQILTFPSGWVSRRIKGEIVDVKWQKNFIVKAKQYERDIVPVHISGRISNFFYNLAKIRKILGIKANLEMFFLPHESINLKERNIHITFGEPISYKSLDKSKTADEWASEIRSLIYTLPNK